MQVPRLRTKKTASDSGFPGPRGSIFSPITSIFRSRRKALVIILVLGCFALLFLLQPWRRWRGNPVASYRDDWQQALLAIDNRNFSLAQTHLSRCLEVSPLNAEAHFLLARTCRRLDDYEGWLDHWRTAAVLGWPQDQLYLEARLKEAQAGNIWKVQQELLGYLLASHPEEALIVEALIKGYLENDNPKDAFRLADEWVKKYPDDSLAWLYHGKVHHYMMFHDKAVEDYERALELKPNQPQAQLWLAEACLSKGKFERAKELYQAYLANYPDEADALSKLAKCEAFLGKREDARTTLDVLLSKYPNHVEGLLARAKVELPESPEKALTWLRRAEAGAPYHPDILHKLYETLRALHQDKEAAQVERRFNDCHAKVNQLVDLKIKLVKEKDNMNLRYRMAVLYMELGREDEAAHWFQTVLYTDPDHRPTLRALADYWEKRGDSRRAAYYRDRAQGNRPPLSSPPN